MLGFATDYAGESASVEEMYRTLSDISEAGFSHIHWTHEWSGDYTYSVYEMIQIREWMDALRLKSKGLHATESSNRRNIQGKYSYRWSEQDRRDYTYMKTHCGSLTILRCCRRWSGEKRRKR